MRRSPRLPYHRGVRAASRWLVPAVALVAVAALLLPGCRDDDGDPRGKAVGATLVSFQSSDGVTLDARLWDRGADRLAIYLHEFRDDQSSWWRQASLPRSPRVSALTFDFRGHGESQGEDDDLEGMVADTLAAVHFARDRGFQRIMLVGAGMGAAVAMIAATEVTDVTVVGLSAPATFDTLTPLEVASALGDRVQLIATRDDLSAAESLSQFRAEAGMDPAQARLYPGRSHGVDLLEDREGADIRTRFDTLLEEFWVPPAQGAVNAAQG